MWVGGQRNKKQWGSLPWSQKKGKEKKKPNMVVESKTTGGGRGDSELRFKVDDNASAALNRTWISPADWLHVWFLPYCEFSFLGEC